MSTPRMVRAESSKRRRMGRRPPWLGPSPHSRTSPVWRRVFTISDTVERASPVVRAISARVISLRRQIISSTTSPRGRPRVRATGSSRFVRDVMEPPSPLPPLHLFSS
jgi:hypothetical protein